ncbi:expressed unknown protein [Ectocarpus siliculosus]|uniref:Uncharacterized protein n=1 Tax=Ectocarpus siliculosus TaxID=2880 RepID=D7FHE1_ECTSI|nr:expressed unknown protein [Ectocarpus siliculosus]|eukprot:CBJ28508.1 expressed unknown protein [Ectocarpus siliculosus]
MCAPTVVWLTTHGVIDGRRTVLCFFPLLVTRPLRVGFGFLVCVRVGDIPANDNCRITHVPPKGRGSHGSVFCFLRSLPWVRYKGIQAASCVFRVLYSGMVLCTLFGMQ